jgi:hypothetical protein
MRRNMLFRSMFLAVALATATVAAGCSKSESAPEVTAENIEDQGVVTEKHDAGEVVWAVAPEGHVRALIKTPDGKPVDKNVSGTLTVKASADAVPVTVPIAPDPKTGLLVAVIPKLEADMTEVKYDLKVDGKPVQGALHLPPGGTNELVVNAKLHADVKLPEGKKGPNGGVIQVVGDDTIEVVADKGSGKVCVYFLDADLKPVKVVPEKTVKVAVVTSAGPEVVVLTPGPDDLYFAGKVNVAVTPVKLSVGIKHKHVSKVALVGWHPGAVVVIGAVAPPVWVVDTGWDVAVGVGVGVGVGVKVGVKPTIIVHDHDDDDDDHHHHWHGKGKGKVHIKGGKGVHIKIH